MSFKELATFDVVHEQLGWPWLAFDSSGKRFAFASAHNRIATRFFDGDHVIEGPSFSLPDDVELSNVHGFSLDAEGNRLAFAAVAGTASIVVTSDRNGELRRSKLEALAGAGFDARAVTFDRSGGRLWISAESESASMLALIDSSTHATIGIAPGPRFPPPATHELHLHPQDDAVLLLAACGDDGTFARVVGWSGEGVEVVPTELDAGGISAGFVGFSADATRVHLAEADELRTHAWPGLHELSSVELADDFISNYSGAVLGGYVFVDGQYADRGEHEDAVMRFDASGLRGRVLVGPAPRGMWAGRLGRDLIVTVDSKGEPARGRVLRVTLPTTSN